MEEITQAVMTEIKDKADKRKKDFESLFQLAEIPNTGIFEIPNQYWPDVLEYWGIRKASPWFLFRTKAGMIQIGWRKRVLSIGWEDTKLRVDIDPHGQVTSSNDFFHASDLKHALDRLLLLKKAFEEAGIEL